MYPFPCPLPAGDIATRRARVRSALLAEFPQLGDVPVAQLPLRALTSMLALYDEAFFAGLFAARLPQLRVVPSSRMTRCAGKFCVTQEAGRAPVVEIRMSTDFLFRLQKGPFLVNGISAPDVLDAFLLVFEHELCHAAEWALHGRCTAHQKVFRDLSRGLFLHRTCTHALPTRVQEAEARGLGLGQSVRFEYEGKTLRGVVSRIGKTASVMVPARHGAWHDKRGSRYDKYTVPLSMLNPN